MTVKESSQLIVQELKPQYPLQEIESFIYLIFNHFMGFRRFDVNLKPDVAIPNHLELQIYDIIEQLKHNKPIQYILSTTEFYGLPFYVDESVLIPRPETEELVKWILDDYVGCIPRIIDLGTGSGCIPIALAKNLPSAEVFAADISEEAIVTAKRNAKQNEVHVEFLKLDILADTLPYLGLFDMVVSNPPYVTLKQKDRMEENVLGYEPHVALFVPENDPLVFYKAIARFASRCLKPNGSLYFEINESLYDETVLAVCQYGFATELKKDINNKYRMLKARLL
jgi:release factor glutamine methyltransferase